MPRNDYNVRRKLKAAFSVVPRTDFEEQTIEYLREYFSNNPDADGFDLTFQITRQSLRDFEREKRTGMASRSVKHTLRTRRR